MSKVTVTICDACSEQIPADDEVNKITIQQGVHIYAGDVCDKCYDSTGWHLPQQKKRQYNKQNVVSE